MDISVILSIIIAVISLSLVPVCMFYCTRCAIRAVDNVGGSSSSDSSQQQSRTNTLIRFVSRINEDYSNGLGSDETNNNDLTLDDRGERRMREKNVLKRVVIKQISNNFVKKRMKPNRKTKEQKQNDNNDVESNKITIPSSSTTSSCITNNHFENDMIKSSIFSQLLALLNKKSNNKTDTFSNDDYDCNNKICGICLEHYNVGDEVCLSTNEQCDHIFHKECILSWLMRHDDCPNCRAMFLSPL